MDATTLDCDWPAPGDVLVDIANYIMFDIDRPLHAYDADKIEGGKLISVMPSKVKA